MGLTLAVLAPTAAFAQTDEPYPTVSTTPTTDVAGTTVTVEDPQAAVATRASALPFTGGDVALLTVLGLAALGSGTAIVVFARRRSVAAHG